MTASSGPPSMRGWCAHRVWIITVDQFQELMALCCLGMGILQHPFLPAGIAFFSPSLLWRSRSLEGVGRGPTMAEHLWVSTVTTVYCKTKLLWPKLTATLIQEHENGRLEENLTGKLCPLSKSTAIACTLGPMTSQPRASDQVYSSRHEFPYQ